MFEGELKKSNCKSRDNHWKYIKRFKFESKFFIILFNGHIPWFMITFWLALILIVRVNSDLHFIYFMHLFTHCKGNSVTISFSNWRLQLPFSLIHLMSLIWFLSYQVPDVVWHFVDCDCNISTLVSDERKRMHYMLQKIKEQEAQGKYSQQWTLYSRKHNGSCSS